MSLKLQISSLESQLSDASLYKEWYEAKTREYDELLKKLEAEERKLFDKDDEIMALNEKVTAEIDISNELRTEITQLKVTIEELREELARKPDPVDDSSSSEREDHSAELEEWKQKFAKLSEEHESLTSEHKKLSSKFEKLESTYKDHERQYKATI